MEVNEYFAPAIEMSELLHRYYMSEPSQKEELADKITACKYLVRLRMLQSHSNKDAIKGILPNNPIINSGKRTFFVNCAVPRVKEVDTLLPYSMPYHRHDFIELVVVLKGEYLQVVNGCEYKHFEGEVCMLNPNVTHRDYVPNSNERILYIGLSKSFLHGELADFFEKHPHLRNFVKNNSQASEQQFILFNPENPQELTRLCMQIAKEDMEKNAGHHLVIKGLLVRLFDLLLKNHKEIIISKSAQEIEKTLVAEMLDYIKNNIAVINRADMAEFFHFNPDYLNRILLRATGQTFSQNVREIQLNTAATMLIESKKSVNAIIQELGFSNKSYFNKIFSEKYGALPGEYRKL